MSKDDIVSTAVKRRTILKAGLAIGAMQVASPFVVKSLADEPIKIGLDNPLTGTFAALGKNELIGAQLAVDQINAKDGILGRKVELVVEDSTSGDTATAVQKALKLIDRDKVDFLHRQHQFGAGAGDGQHQLRERRVPHRARRPYRQRHRHPMPLERLPRLQHDADGDEFGLRARSSTNTARSGTSSRTDYAFGHALQQGFEASLKAANGTELGADFTPLGTTDFSANLIKAQSDQPRRDHLAARGRRHDQLPQAGGAVRPRQEDPHRRRAAGARGQRGPAARGAVRRLGVRMVLEAARRAACRRVRRRYPQAQRRQGADGAHLVRLRGDLDLRARRRTRRSRSMRSRWPRRCRVSSCRPKSR